MLDPELVEFTINVGERMANIANSIARTNTVVYTPGLYIKGYEKESPNDPGVFDFESRNYSISFISIQEIDLVAEGIDPKQANKGYDVIGFCIDQRGKLIPINLFNCTLEGK